MTIVFFMQENFSAKNHIDETMISNFEIRTYVDLLFIEFLLVIKKIFPDIPILHGICFVFFMYLNKFIVKVKRDILTFFVQPCLSPFQLDRGLMTHIKLKSFKHEWIYLKVEFDFRLHLPLTYPILNFSNLYIQTYRY